MQRGIICVSEDNHESRDVAAGYADAARAMGWHGVAVGATFKAEVLSILSGFEPVAVVLTSERLLRHVPIDLLREKNIPAICYVSPRPVASDVEQLLRVPRRVLLANMSPAEVCGTMAAWINPGLTVTATMPAGNLVVAKPKNLNIVSDLALICRTSVDVSLASRWLVPLIQRYGHSIRIGLYGHPTLTGIAGAMYFGRADEPDEVADVYGTARITLNLANPEVSHGLNQATFQIPLAGGFQITNSPEATSFAISKPQIVPHVTAVCQFIDWLSNTPQARNDIVRASLEHVAYHHTYFNRLAQIFGVIGMCEEQSLATKTGTRLAFEHMAAMDRMLTGAERGIDHEKLRACFCD